MWNGIAGVLAVLAVGYSMWGLYLTVRAVVTDDAFRDYWGLKRK